MRLSGVGRLVRMARLGSGTRVPVAVRLGVWLRRRLVTRTVVVTRAAIGRAGFAPGRIRSFLRWPLSLRRFRQPLDTDVVFLVGAPDHGGEGFRSLSGYLEFGGGVHDADGADIMLVDATTTAN